MPGPAVPLLIGAGVLGLLFLGKKKTNPVDQDQATIIPGFAGSATVISNGLIATIPPSTTPPQPLQPGKRAPTVLELATAESFLMTSSADKKPLPSQVARALAFQQTLPDVDWNSVTDAQINAAVVFIMSDAFTVPPGGGIQEGN